MKYYILLSVAFLLTSCDFKQRNNTSKNNEQTILTEDSYEAKRIGYNKGYQDGYSDGYGWMEHGVSYNDRSYYQTDEALRAYRNGYSNGYDEGYYEGESKQKAERERARLSDWHNWEDEDVDALYVYLEGVEDDDVAEYIARERYEGSYIRKGWKYFAKIDYTWGEYNVTLGESIDSDLYKVQGTDIYIHFTWGLPDVSYGDEGVLDWSGTFSRFYKKPDNF